MHCLTPNDYAVTKFEHWSCPQSQGLQGLCNTNCSRIWKRSHRNWKVVGKKPAFFRTVVQLHSAISVSKQLVMEFTDTTLYEVLCLKSSFFPLLISTWQRDLTTGAGKGFGFVTYNDYNDAVSAIQAMNGYEFEKNGYKPLQVSFKTSKRKW